MKVLNAKHVQLTNVTANSLRSHKRLPASRPRYAHTKAIAAPERLQEEQQGTIRLLDLDNAEQARLEQTDAFKELVALHKNKQSVNRPQQAGSRCASSAKWAHDCEVLKQHMCRLRS